MPQHTDDTPPHSDSDATLPNGRTSGEQTAASSAPIVTRSEHTDKAGDEVGPYKLISKLGEGGFGAVWLAERRKPFLQQVALKIVKLGMDSKSVVARFEQERQALAVMNHPHVAKVIDGGLTPNGRPYFAMEYVKGEPITNFCDRQKLSIKQRLQLFAQVCEAVQHAHTKGIIHRDLKPSNILVASGDSGTGQAKVIDFGVAKALTQRMSEHTIFTETGQMIGTPEYMSPEQAEPDANDIDTRSDVYSLGVVLYELLAGAPPFDPKELRRKAMREIQRIIREDDPPSPSAKLSTIATKDTALASRIAEARKDAAATLTRTLRSELEWIPLKAMRKERKERYDSPSDLARDVQNYLEGRPLVAAPESTAYRVRKYIRRNRGFVIGATTVLAALMLGLGLATWQWQRAEIARTEAVAAKDAATANEALAISARHRAEDLLGWVAISAALTAAQHSDIAICRRELAFIDSLGRGDHFAAGLARSMSDSSIGGPSGHEDLVCSVAFSPDGKTLASASGDKTIRLWDAATAKPIGEPLRGHEDWVRSVAFSPDGKTLASASDDKTIRLWDAATAKPIGVPLRRRRHVSPVTVAFDPGGKAIVSTWDDGEAVLWEFASGGKPNPLGAPSDKASARLPFWISVLSPAGKTFAHAQHLERDLELWDAATGKRIGEPLRGHRDRIASVAFSPDGKTLASGSADNTIRLWDTAIARSIGEPLRGHGGGVTAVAFSPDGMMLASASEDGTIRLWDAIPLRNRIGAIRATVKQMDEVRGLLADLIARTEDSQASVATLQAAVLADPRITGILRRAALIVVGELAIDRQTRGAGVADSHIARLNPLKQAFAAQDWPRTLELLREIPDADTSSLGTNFLNTVAWKGLTEVPAGSPLRDLNLLLQCAERAVELSNETDGAALDTLARAHWELGDKPKAIEVQREAVAAAEASLPTMKDEKIAAATRTLLDEMKATLAAYERDQPPAPPAAAPASVKPSP